MPLARIIISAPFGNRIELNDCTSTLGTYTWQRRAGSLKRLWRIIRTLRPRPSLGGWTNKLGLPNEGLEYFVEQATMDATIVRPRRRKFDLDEKIISVQGRQLEEWTLLFRTLRTLLDREFYGQLAGVELNLSCPNVEAADSRYVEQICRRALYYFPREINRGPRVIVKLPPLRWLRYAGPAQCAGVDHFHACNTIPTPAGGLSGRVLQQYSLWCVEQLKDRWGDKVCVIGGGGVRSADDVIAYMQAGADHVAVGSALFRPPWHARKLLRHLSDAFVSWLPTALPPELSYYKELAYWATPKRCGSAPRSSEELDHESTSVTDCGAGAPGQQPGSLGAGGGGAVQA